MFSVVIIVFGVLWFLYLIIVRSKFVSKFYIENEELKFWFTLIPIISLTIICTPSLIILYTFETIHFGPMLIILTFLMLLTKFMILIIYSQQSFTLYLGFSFYFNKSCRLIKVHWRRVLFTHPSIFISRLLGIDTLMSLLLFPLLNAEFFWYFFTRPQECQWSILWSQWCYILSLLGLKFILKCKLFLDIYIIYHYVWPWILCALF